MQPPFQSIFSQYHNTHRILKRLARALIRLCICAGCSEAKLLVAHTSLLEISCRGSFCFRIENSVCCVYHLINSGKFFVLFCCLLNFFSFFFKKSFRNVFSVKHFGSRLMDLIWVLSVCKSHQQMTLAGNELLKLLKDLGIYLHFQE